MAHPSHGDPLNNRVQEVLLQVAYNSHVRVLQRVVETPGILLMEAPSADSEEDVSLSIDSSRFNFCDGRCITDHEMVLDLT